MNADLIAKAVEAATHAYDNAYASYSGFCVGACVVDSAGEMYAGCNVENASYGLTQCAERTAVCTATAAGHRDLQLCVVVTDTANPTAPCGACRQVLYECNPAMLVISCTISGVTKQWCVADLLPEAFNQTSLKNRNG